MPRVTLDDDLPRTSVTISRVEAKILKTRLRSSQEVVRMEKPAKNGIRYEFGEFRLDAAQRVIFRAGRAVPLAPKVLETLLALVERSGTLVTKDELMARLWPDTFVEEANLTQNVFQLRKVLGEGQDKTNYIETVPRRGYRFMGEVKTLVEEEGVQWILANRRRTHIVHEEETNS